MQNYIKQNVSSVFGMLLSLYVVLFVNLGTGTFAQHVLRILTTRESEALARDVYDSIARFVGTLVHHVESLIDWIRGYH